MTTAEIIWFLRGLGLGAVLAGGAVSLVMVALVLNGMRRDRLARQHLARECLDADAIHGDVPALRRGEVVHDYTEAVR